MLVQAAPRILPALRESLSVAATRSLQDLGVEVLTNSRVDSVDDGGEEVGKRRIDARTVLWTAGVMASPAGRWIGAERDAVGRIITAPDLSVPGCIMSSRSAIPPRVTDRMVVRFRARRRRQAAGTLRGEGYPCPDRETAASRSVPLPQRRLDGDDRP
jgi:hypothetical protein